jgi:hypothetical protein
VYGRTRLQELRLEGRRLVNRHYYGDGRWGWPKRTGSEGQAYRGWTVAKYRPRKTRWARSSATKARMTHAIRYQLTATHSSGEVVYLVVWRCGGHAQSKPRIVRDPEQVCAACVARLSGVRTVPLREAL